MVLPGSRQLSIPETPGSWSYRSSERGIPNCLALSTRRGAHGDRQTDRQTSQQRMGRNTAEKVLPRVFLDGSRWRGKATEMSIRGNPAQPIAEPSFSQHFFHYSGDRLDQAKMRVLKYSARLRPFQRCRVSAAQLLHCPKHRPGAGVQDSTDPREAKQGGFVFFCFFFLFF